jgi:CDP-diacylglycerol pyrophosphatase
MNLTTRTAISASFAIAVAMTAGTARAADPDALWKIVHLLCVPDELEHGNPAPCAEVDLRRGVDGGDAVLKDLSGATQYLLIPTARVEGIESPEILAPGAANYFADAWHARSFVETAAHRAIPRDDLALAVNSAPGRTQDQLHIHIDCIRADVRDALHAHADALTDTWAPLGVPLAGHRYIAITIARAELGDINPFRSLFDGVPAARDAMGGETLVVAGIALADGRPGFVLLARHADPAAGDLASGEELQDHACGVIAPRQP